MAPDTGENTRFMAELYRQTQGDTTAQVSMYAVGEALGLEKAEAGKIAENLIALGLIEIKTLAGGIGITADGLETVNDGAGSRTSQKPEAPLGKELLLTATARQSVETLVADLKTAAPAVSGDYERLTQLVMDVKALELHLLTAGPKTAVVRELLRSLRDLMKSAGQDDLEKRLGRITGSQ